MVLGSGILDHGFCKASGFPEILRNDGFACVMQAVRSGLLCGYEREMLMTRVRIGVALALLAALAACGPDYGGQGSRQFRGDDYGNVGAGRSSYGYQGGPT